MWKGSKLTLDPRLRSALLNFLFPILQVMVGVPGSLHLTSMFWTKALMFCAKKHFFLTLSVLLTVQRSFKYLAYLGTCLITSSNRNV